MKKLLILALACAYGFSIHSMDEKRPLREVVTKPQALSQDELEIQCQQLCQQLIERRNFEKISNDSFPFNEASKFSTLLCVSLKEQAKSIKTIDYLQLKASTNANHGTGFQQANPSIINNFINSAITLGKVSHILEPLINRK